MRNMLRTDANHWGGDPGKKNDIPDIKYKGG